MWVPFLLYFFLKINLTVNKLFNYKLINVVFAQFPSSEVELRVAALETESPLSAAPLWSTVNECMQPKESVGCTCSLDSGAFFN